MRDAASVQITPGKSPSEQSRKTGRQSDNLFHGCGFNSSSFHVSVKLVLAQRPRVHKSQTHLARC